MITVRFFGLTRLIIKQGKIELEAGNIEELLKKVCKEFKELRIKDLKNSIILCNGENILELKSFKTSLKPGDEVLIISPVAGG
jgi:molybdopterin converting factor small subunit